MGAYLSVDERPVRRTERVAVVIPAFRARATISRVLAAIGPEVSAIYVVDDKCPDGSGELAFRECADPRLTVLHNSSNLGVGGAVKRGYRQALADGADIIVKLDADAQMDPRHIPRLIAPILKGSADYAKGDRFAPVERMPPGTPRDALAEMPLSRHLANRAISLIHRLATGYWSIRDPANGYTAVHARALRRIPMKALADCFFFETDMLFRLNLSDAMVVDVPLPAHYPGSSSSLSLRRVAPRFAAMMVRRCLERLRFRYFRGRPNLVTMKLSAGSMMIAAAAIMASWSLMPVAGAGQAGGSGLIWSLLLIGFGLLVAALIVDSRRRPGPPVRRGDSLG